MSYRPKGETTHYILHVASLRGPPIGGQENDRVSYLCSAPYTLLPLRGISPQGETRDMERKTASHILHVPFRRFPSLVAGATTFPPTSWWDYGCLAMEPWASAGKHRAICSVPRMGWQGNTIRKGAKRPENRVTRFPVEKVRRSRIRGSRAAANHQNAYHVI